VTGVVFVTLEFKEDAGSPRFINPESDAVEVPTTASPMSELTESAGQVIARLSKIDVNGISDNLLRLTQTLNEKLETIDVVELEANLTASSNRLHDILAAPELGRLPRRLDEAIAEFKKTNELLRGLIEGMERPVSRLDTIALHLQTTMDALEATSESTRDMLAEDAEFRQSLEGALMETAKTMKSLRRLTDMLERNPRAMLSGKPEDRK
jgi:paraquat-inducible protein B